MRSTGVSPALARPSRTVTPAHEAPLAASRNPSAAAPGDDFNAQLAQAQQNAAPPAETARTSTSSGSERAGAGAAGAAGTASTGARPAAPAANPPGASRSTAGRTANAAAAAARPVADARAAAAAATTASDAESSAAATAATLAAEGPAARAAARRAGAPLPGGTLSAAAASDAASDAAATPTARTDAAAALAVLAGARVAAPLGGATRPAVGNEPEEGQDRTSKPNSDADADDVDPTAANGTNAAQLALLLPMLAAVPAPPAVTASTGVATAVTSGVTGAGSGGIAGTGQPRLDGSLLAGLAHTLAGLDAPTDAVGAGAGRADDTDAGRATEGITAAPTADAASDTGTTSLAGLDAALTASRTTAGGAAPLLPVHAAVGSPQWPEEIGSHLLLMSTHGIQSAELRLTPADLGPVQVRIDVQDGAASVWFQASHPDTRAALENALPQLRDMLAGQGLTLTDAGVNRDSPRDAPPPRTASASVQALEPVGTSSAAAVGAVRLGLIDAYA